MRIKLSGYFLIIIIGIAFYTLSCSVKKSVSKTINSDSLAQANNQAAIVDTEYYSIVEKTAKFQNGDVNTYITYLKKNTKYPIYSLRRRQQGTVIIQFGVDCFGTVKIFSVLKSSGFKVLDDEAKRSIGSSPKWTPAKIGNKSVGQLMVLQVHFNAKTRMVEIH
jgi:TonB family protein